MGHLNLVEPGMAGHGDLVAFRACFHQPREALSEPMHQSPNPGVLAQLPLAEHVLPKTSTLIHELSDGIARPPSGTGIRGPALRRLDQQPHEPMARWRRLAPANNWC